MGKHWSDTVWTVIDLETTGLDFETVHVVQLGVATLQRGKVLGIRSTLCNPGIPIPPEATAIHGITDEMVSDAPSELQVLRELFFELLEAECMVHYNGLGYDMQILEKILGKRAIFALRRVVPEVDVLTIVREKHVGKFWSGKGRHKLTTVAARFGISWVCAHNAGADCVMTGRVLWELIQSNDWVRGLPGDIDVGLKLRRLARDQEEASQRWVERQREDKPA